MFTDPVELEKFGDFWRQLSVRLISRPNDRVAYELMNEAVATDPNDWNRVAMTGIEAIREMEAERAILLGSNRWNSAHTFDQLQVPDDKNIVLTFHFYLPMLFTHHRAPMVRGGADATARCNTPEPRFRRTPRGSASAGE